MQITNNPLNCKDKSILFLEDYPWNKAQSKSSTRNN